MKINQLHNKFKLMPVSFAIAAAISSSGAIAQEKSAEAIEVIQVSGIRSSLSKAMQLKQDASSIQDSIVAEDLGKFPDQNVAESLQRISGVMIDRNNGEGSKVTVRGMGPQFNEVKVNNRTLATTDRGREFDFQTLPAELISGADVIKASRANIAEGSLGAYINVNTARPFNNTGFHANGSFSLTDNDLADKSGFKFSGVVSNTFLDDSLGILVGISQSEATNRIDAAGTNRWGSFFATDHNATYADGTPVQDIDLNNDGIIANGTGAFVDSNGNVLPNERVVVRHPGRATYSIDTETRERTSANITAQWAQSDNIIHTFDLLYSDLSRQADSSGMQIPLQSGGTWDDLVISKNGTLQSATKYGAKIDGLPIQRGQDSETISAGLNSVIYKDRWTITSDLSYSKAESAPRVNEMTFHYVNPEYNQVSPFGNPYTDPQAAIDFAEEYYNGGTNYLDGQIKGAVSFTNGDPRLNDPAFADKLDYISVDNTGNILSITDTSIDISDPGAIRSWWTQVQHNELEDEVVEASLDFQYDMDHELVESVEFGARYTDRKKSDSYFSVENGCFDVPNRVGLPDVYTEEKLGRALTTEEAQINGFINRNTLEPGNTCNDLDLDDNLFSINNSNFLADESGNFPRNFTLINDIEAFKGAMGVIRNQEIGSANDWTKEIERPTRSVINTEETLALYAQVNLQGETDLFSWSGNVGLRYVDTKTTSTGHTRLVEDYVFRSTDANDGTIIDIEYTANEAVKKGTDYDHFLPSINLNFDLDNGIFVKTAAAKVITRPAIENTGVNRTSPDNVRLDQYFTSGNNPDLAPYEATQFDLALEYYQDNGNAYSVGVFYKNIDTFISTQNVFKDTGYNFQDFNGNDIDLIERSYEPSNRKGGTVQGFEVAALHFFDYLPGYLSGFGVQANFTYTKTDDKVAANEELATAEALGVTNVGLAGNGLEGFSDKAYNFIAFYDKDSFQARLAYNWRSAYLQYRTGPTLGASGIPQHVDDFGQFDFSTSYDVNETLTIRAEAINLTNENHLRYADIRERMILNQYTGRRYQVGISAKF